MSGLPTHTLLLSILSSTLLIIEASFSIIGVSTRYILECEYGFSNLLLYKAEKPSVRIFLVEWFFAVDARIHVKLARNEAPVFWEHEVCFYNVLTPAVRHLRRFECQGVDDSCQNFTYIPANRSPDTIDNIYYIFFQ